MVFFTLCSNNYLAHAGTLAESIKKFYPGGNLILGLVDKRDPTIDYESLPFLEIIDFNEIGYDFMDEMLGIYNVIEFNTAVKPFYFEYLLKRLGSDGIVIYLDPDIYLYNTLDDLVAHFKDHSILLTPNLIQLPREVCLGELASLRHGMFNLGFIGLKNNENSIIFIKWWQVRLRKYCLIKKSSGLFVDQKWVDFAPLYFEGIFILRNLGYNVAWWNLSERNIFIVENSYFINDLVHKMYFFHFSGFDPDYPQVSSRVDSSILHSLKTNSAVNQLLQDYSKRLIFNGYHKYVGLKPLLKFKLNIERSPLLRLKEKIRSLKLKIWR